MAPVHSARLKMIQLVGSGTRVIQNPSIVYYIMSSSSILVITGHFLLVLLLSLLCFVAIHGLFQLLHFIQHFVDAMQGDSRGSRCICVRILVWCYGGHVVLLLGAFPNRRHAFAPRALQRIPQWQFRRGIQITPSTFGIPTFDRFQQIGIKGIDTALQGSSGINLTMLGVLVIKDATRQIGNALGRGGGILRFSHKRVFHGFFL